MGKPFKLQFLYFPVAETISHAELYWELPNVLHLNL